LHSRRLTSTQGAYELSPSQQQVFGDFASLLSEFDPQAAERLLVDVQQAAHEKTGLADYFGTEV
jgi:hypothetical protein